MTNALPVNSGLGLPPIEDEPEDQGANGAALPPAAAVEIRLLELATMPRIDYDRIRQAEADKLGCRVTTLDGEVEKRRPRAKTDGADDPFGWHVEPVVESVDGAELLDDLVAELSERVILPKHGPEATALWVLHCWTLDATYFTPFLALASPEMRCGKSLVLALLSRLVPKPLAASNITAAALFRTVEKWGPTLLVDEADSFVRDNEELRGILNSGHSRDTAFVVRTTGEDFDPMRFATWCAKAIAGIGKLPATVQDRAIVIPMRRKMAGEKIAGRSPEDAPRCLALRQRCARWAADNLEQLHHRHVEPPAGLNDRASDNWSHLLAIADLAGGSWPARARAAALALSGADAEADSIRSELLADIRAILAEITEEGIKSADLARELGDMAEKPWSEWKAGKPITQRQLAKALAPFGIRPGTIRVGKPTTTAKGYAVVSFADAFGRYLSPPQGAAPSVTPSQVAAAVALGPNAIRHNEDLLRIENQPKAAAGLGCDVVTDRRGGIASEDMPAPDGLPEQIDADPDEAPL